MYVCVRLNWRDLSRDRKREEIFRIARPSVHVSLMIWRTKTKCFFFLLIGIHFIVLRHMYSEGFSIDRADIGTQSIDYQMLFNKYWWILIHLSDKFYRHRIIDIFFLKKNTFLSVKPGNSCISMVTIFKISFERKGKNTIVYCFAIEIRLRNHSDLMYT